MVSVIIDRSTRSNRSLIVCVLYNCTRLSKGEQVTHGMLKMRVVIQDCSHLATLKWKMLIYNSRTTTKIVIDGHYSIDVCINESRAINGCCMTCESLTLGKHISNIHK